METYKEYGDYLPVIHSHLVDGALTRTILLEKIVPKFKLVQLYVPSPHSGFIYIDNFHMPESMYVIIDPPKEEGIPIEKIVATAKIIKYKNGYYAHNIQPVGAYTTLGNLCIEMLYSGKAEIHLAGSGTLNSDHTVKSYSPSCLYFKKSQ